MTDNIRCMKQKSPRAKSKMNLCRFLLFPFVVSIVGACTHVDNSKGMKTVDLDPTSRGVIAGVGADSSDIVGIADKMMRDLLTVPELTQRARPPRVAIDAEYFRNESSQAINKNLITDRLRVALNRAARGKMVFVGRHYADMVAHERDLKRQGITDTGTTGLTAAQAGLDFRLGGNFASQDEAASDGTRERFTQIVLEMVDVENGTIVWSNEYSILRAGQDNVVYR